MHSLRSSAIALVLGIHNQLVSSSSPASDCSCPRVRPLPATQSSCDCSRSGTTHRRGTRRRAGADWDRSAQAEKARKRKEKLQAHRFVTIKVVTDDDVRRHVAAEAFDLVRLDTLAPEHVLKVPKTATWGEVQAQLAAVTGVPAADQCFRRWSARDNGTLRPNAVVPVRSPCRAVPVPYSTLCSILCGLCDTIACMLTLMYWPCRKRA